MLQNLINNKKIYIPLALIIIILGYFYWPQTFKNINEDQASISISKDIDGKTCYYDFSDQEVKDFIKILEKSKFCHGVSWPDRTFADKSVSVSMICDLGSIRISIYYDTDKTYTSALLPTEIILNNRYRISNKDEISNYIENIINTKNAEFYPSDNHIQEWHWAN